MASASPPSVAEVSARVEAFVKKAFDEGKDTEWGEDFVYLTQRAVSEDFLWLAGVSTKYQSEHYPDNDTKMMTLSRIIRGKAVVRDGIVHSKENVFKDASTQTDEPEQVIIPSTSITTTSFLPNFKGTLLNKLNNVTTALNSKPKPNDFDKMILDNVKTVETLVQTILEICAPIPQDDDVEQTAPIPTAFSTTSNFKGDLMEALKTLQTALKSKSKPSEFDKFALTTVNQVASLVKLHLKENN